MQRTGYAVPQPITVTPRTNNNCNCNDFFITKLSLEYSVLEWELGEAKDREQLAVYERKKCTWKRARNLPVPDFLQLGMRSRSSVTPTALQRLTNCCVINLLLSVISLYCFAVTWRILATSVHWSSRTAKVLCRASSE